MFSTTSIALDGSSSMMILAAATVLGARALVSSLARWRQFANKRGLADQHQFSQFWWPCWVNLWPMLTLTY